MQKIRGGAAAIGVLLTLAFTAGAQAIPLITTSTVTTPADGSLLFQNLDSNPNATFTVSGTTDGTTGDRIDIGCYSGTTDYHDYDGTTTGSGSGVAVSADGSFSVAVPYSFFASGTCNLVAVPHGTSTNTLPAGDTGSRVTFSFFQTSQTSAGATYNYAFDDVTLRSSEGADSIDNCGPYTYLVDGTSAMDVGPYVFDCAGSLYNSRNDFYGWPDDRPTSEIEVDGINAYGSTSADQLFTGSDSLAGFPSLTATLDSFNTTTRDAQTTESEPLVECSNAGVPDNTYNPSASDCTAFTSTGVAIKRVTQYIDDAHVATVTDTFTSTDRSAHALQLQYEADLPAGAGLQFPGQSSPATPGPSDTEPAPSSTPGTIFAIDMPGTAPSLANPVGAMTFSAPYHGVTFDNTLWGGGYLSPLFDYQETVPAGGSVSITWSYATGASMSEVQGYAAAAQDAMQPAVVTISTPTTGTTEASAPVTVSGSASAGSGVKSVTVDGVSATVSGSNWTASVPLTLGNNTLTATATTNAGHTANASVTVDYAPPATVTLGEKSFNGKAVSVKLTCGAAGSSCAGVFTLAYRETLVKHHRKHHVTLVIARKHYALNPGQAATVSAGLSGTGRRLLKTFRRLTATGSVTVIQPGGKSTGAGTFTITLKRPGKKHHK